MDRFADRFDAALYADDEPVVVSVATPSGDTVAIGDAAFRRLHLLAVAYGLHVLSDIVTPYEKVRLAAAQADGLLAELEFLAETVRDPIVVDAVSALQPVVTGAIRANATLTVGWDI
jgi:hypothetical protein